MLENRPIKRVENWLLKAKKQVDDYEKKHNIKKHIFYNNFYADQKYVKNLKELVLGEG